VTPRLEGHAHPAGRSLREPAILAPDPGLSDHLRLTGPEGRVLSVAPAGEVRADPPLGRGPRRIRFPDGALFETEDHAGVAALFPPTGWDILHWLEAFHPRLAAVVLGVALGAWLIWRHGLDLLIAAAIYMTPPPLVAAMDAGTLDALDRSIAERSALPPQEKARLKWILGRLDAALEHSESPPGGFRLEFRTMPALGPNAFALPGGTIVMTDSLVEAFPDDDTLAAVLAHEIGHVVEQHGLRQVYRSLSVYVIVALLAGDVGPVLEDILLEGSLFVSLAYSRAHESAADRFAVRLSREAGYDPAALARFFEELEARFGAGPPAWLSTHPVPGDRAAEILQLIENP